MADYSYLGAGKVWLEDLSGTAGLIQAGNCSALTFGVSEDTKELKDFTQPGGGTYNEVRRISAVEMSSTMHDLSGPNIARAVYGANTTVASAAVTAEAHTVKALGSLITCDFLPTTAAIVVKKGATTYVENTDYTREPSGIVPKVGGTMVAADAITFDYQKAAQDVVQALVNSGKEYRVVFDGLNEARSGKKTRIIAHRVKIGALASLGLIGEDYGAMECTGKLLKDTSITGAGISQYFKVEIEA
jgi:hypothetical protein